MQKTKIAQSKQRLLSALAKLLSYTAIEDVRITDLLTAAQVSHSTFYRYWATKEEFYSWVLNYYMDGLSMAVQAKDTSPLQFYRHYFSYINANAVYFRTFNNSSIWPQFNYELYEIGIGIYTDSLQQAGLPKQRAYLIGSYVVNAHIGVVMNWLREPQDQSVTPELLAATVTTMSSAALASQGVELKQLFPYRGQHKR